MGFFNLFLNYSMTKRIKTLVDEKRNMWFFVDKFLNYWRINYIRKSEIRIREKKYHYHRWWPVPEAGGLMFCEGLRRDCLICRIWLSSSLTICWSCDTRVIVIVDVMSRRSISLLLVIWLFLVKRWNGAMVHTSQIRCNWLWRTNVYTK